MEVLKVIIFIIAFFLIVTLVIFVYKKKSKNKIVEEYKQEDANAERQITATHVRTINEHLSHVINKDNNNEH